MNKSVVFDVGGVLLQWNPSKIVEPLFGSELDRKEVLEGVFGHPDWHLLDGGAITEAEAIERFARRLSLSTGRIKSLVEAAKESLQPLPGAFEVVHYVKNKGGRTYCLSNMPVETYSYLKGKYDIWNYFDGLVISGEVKKSKPNPDIYQHLLSKFALDPASLLFFDDRADNVEAARTEGIKGVVFTDAQQARLEIDNWL